MVKGLLRSHRTLVRAAVALDASRVGDAVMDVNEPPVEPMSVPTLGDVKRESNACAADALNTEKHDTLVAEILEQTERLIQVIDAVGRSRQ